MEVGKSREMLNSIHILTSRLLSSQVGIKVTGCHKVTASVMEQFFRNRLDSGNWIEDVRSCGRDILALGLGVAAVGLEEDPKSGLQKISVRHHEPWYTIFDLYQNHLERAGWVCFIHHLSPDEAIKLGFKLHDVEVNHFTVMNDGDGDSYGNSTRPVVRVFEYFDHQTRCLILGALDSGIIKRTDNLFGCLPFVVGTGHYSPVLAKPYGRVFSEGASSEFLNQIQVAWKRQLGSSKRMIEINADRLDKGDLNLWKEGKTEIVKVIDAIEGSAIEYHAAQPVDPNILAALQYARGQYRSASNLSDMDRGQMASRRVSATEVDTLQSITNANRTSEVESITSFIRRLAEKVFEIGKVWDSAPLVVDIMGSEVTINDPAEPNSRLSLVFDESEYRVLVDSDSLTANDDRTKKAMALAELRELEPFAQAGTIPIEKLARRKLEIMGEDPSEWNIGGPPKAQSPLPQQGGQPRVEDIARGQLRSNMNAEQR
jgi:hypothetical protein